MIGPAGSSTLTNLSSLKQYTMNSLSAITNRVYAEISDNKEDEMEKGQDEAAGLDLNIDLGLGGDLDDDVDDELDEEKLNQRRDTLASIDSGLGEDLTESEQNDEELRAENYEGANCLYERIEDFEVDSEVSDLETGLRLISLDEVRDHCSLEDGWMVLFDRVYNVSHLVRLHPGGEEVMADYLGYDATIAFQGVGHSKAASRMLQPNLIGILPQQERLNYTQPLSLCAH